MALDIQQELIEQLTWHWEFHARPRLDGLTDHEYLWEPVAGMWSVRPRGQATTSTPLGSGAMVADHESRPDPAPLTTIAWRISHVIAFFDVRYDGHFGDGTLTYETVVVPDGVDDALRSLDASYERWVGALQTMPPQRLAEPVGLAEGPFAEHPWASLIQHINREAIHHAAEIALMRDLYHWRHGWKGDDQQ